MSLQCKLEGVSKLKNSEKRQIVGAAGIPARSTASSRNLLVSCCNAAGRNARGSYSLLCQSLTLAQILTFDTPSPIINYYIYVSIH